MKKLFIAVAAFATAFGTNAQIKTPQMSPASTIKQTIGLTDFVIEYARPSKRDRVVFGDVVPYNEVWRTGANKNTTFMTSDNILFGNDTLKAGTYALYTKPMKDSWDIIFYATTDNWGTPDEWNEKNVVLKTNAKVSKMNDKVETFTIAFENLSTKNAMLTFAWDDVKVMTEITLLTDEKTRSSIAKVMAGPSSNDYFAAARYYYEEKQNLNEALTYINKSIEMQKEAPFYFYRLKSLIQAENGDKAGAISTAKISLEGAKKVGNQSYIDMNEKSIKEWSK